MKEFLAKLKELSEEYNAIDFEYIIKELRGRLKGVPSHYIHLNSFTKKVDMRYGEVRFVFYADRFEDQVAGILVITPELCTPRGQQELADMIIWYAEMERKQATEKEQRRLKNEKLAAELELARINRLLGES